jgi:branched-chain amino acid transport system ATP-binding protein
MSEPLLKVAGLGKRFGGFVALNDINIEVGRGERLGLIGPNGSGKSTFVNCIGGAQINHSGEVWFDGRRLNGLASNKRAELGLARTFQLPRAFKSLTLAENLAIPLRFLTTGGDPLGEALERLKRVGLADKAGALPRDLSQVDLRRLELARALACRPKLLIADEAMAGLAHAEVDEILDLLFAANKEGVAVIMIEHIMRAVTAFAERLVVFVAGRKLAEGPTAEVLRMREVEAAYLGE